MRQYKTTLMLILTLLPMAAGGNYDESKRSNPKESAHSQAAAVSGAVSKSVSNAISSSDSGDSSSIVSDASSVTIHTEAISVASSAASLNLTYCSEGGSGQSKDGGISFGGVSYICEAVSSIEVALMFVKADLDAARACKDNSEQQRLHLQYAHESLADAREIQGQIITYIDNRSNTASIGAWVRDIMPALLFIAGLIILL